MNFSSSSAKSSTGSPSGGRRKPSTAISPYATAAPFSRWAVVNCVCNSESTDGGNPPSSNHVVLAERVAAISSERCSGISAGGMVEEIRVHPLYALSRIQASVYAEGVGRGGSPRLSFVFPVQRRRRQILLAG